jgi:hypothetical protein
VDLVPQTMHEPSSDIEEIIAGFVDGDGLELRADSEVLAESAIMEDDVPLQEDIDEVHEADEDDEDEEEDETTFV